jgi:hypothetical protein
VRPGAFGRSGWFRSVHINYRRHSGKGQRVDRNVLGHHITDCRECAYCRIRNVDKLDAIIRFGGY